MAANDLITFRKGTASQWTSANPILASGEPGYDLTNSVLKIGDGVSNWVALSGIGSTSLNNSSSSSSVGVRGIINTTGNLTSFAISGGYPVGYLDLFQDGVKLVSSLDFSATDGSNVTLSNSVPSGTVLEYLTMSSGLSSGSSGGSSGFSWSNVPSSPSASGTNGDVAYDSSYFYLKSASGWKRAAIATWTPLGAPTSVSGVRSSEQVTVSWATPVENGGYPITDYAVQYSSDSGANWITFSDGTSANTSATITGLSNGTAYTFRVAAINTIGQGSWSSASSSVTPGAGDPYFANVSLLLHFDGVGSSITDSSTLNNSFSLTGSYGTTPTQSTDYAVFGAKSLTSVVFGQLSVASSAAFGFGISDFTIEGWWYRTNTSGGYGYNNDVLWTLSGGGTPDIYLMPGYRGPYAGTNKTQASFGAAATSDWQDGFGTTVTPGQWHHVAMSRVSGTMHIYLDGTRILSKADSTDYGSAKSFVLQVYDQMYFDEIRVTKGIGRYSGASISIPTDAFPSS
jgi:hypothetical protein